MCACEPSWTCSRCRDTAREDPHAVWDEPEPDEQTDRDAEPWVGEWV